MATIAAVLTGPTNDGLTEVVWETLTTTNRVGSGVLLAATPDMTVQVIGNFAGTALLKIEGSNDGGTTWAGCHDIAGDLISIGAAGMVLVVENPKLIRPNLIDGNGTADLDVYLIATAH